MKILIFSDTHLSNQFSEKKFAFLKKIITEANQVIINGDFWEGMAIPFDQFIHSPWQQLFPLLLKKQTVYIYGNHDPKSIADERVKLFSNKQVEQYHLPLKNKVLVIEHGKNYALKFFPDTYYPLNKLGQLFLRLYKFTENFFSRLFAGLFFKITYSLFNWEAKLNWRKKNTNQEILVLGHTHCPEKNLPQNYLNSGLINNSFASFLVIENNEVTLFQQRY